MILDDIKKDLEYNNKKVLNKMREISMNIIISFFKKKFQFYN